MASIRTDLLPDELAPTIAGMIEAGTAAMKRTMESGSSGTKASPSAP